jgi:hypothetical protein
MLLLFFLVISEARETGHTHQEEEHFHAIIAATGR